MFSSVAILFSLYPTLHQRWKDDVSRYLRMQCVCDNRLQHDLSAGRQLGKRTTVRLVTLNRHWWIAWSSFSLHTSQGVYSNTFTGWCLVKRRAFKKGKYINRDLVGNSISWKLVCLHFSTSQKRWERLTYYCAKHVCESRGHLPRERDSEQGI